MASLKPLFQNSATFAPSHPTYKDGSITFWVHEMQFGDIKAFSSCIVRGATCVLWIQSAWWLKSLEDSCMLCHNRLQNGPQLFGQRPAFHSGSIDEGWQEAMRHVIFCWDPSTRGSIEPSEMCVCVCVWRNVMFQNTPEVHIVQIKMFMDVLNGRECV